MLKPISIAQFTQSVHKQMTEKAPSLPSASSQGSPRPVLRCILGGKGLKTSVLPSAWS